MQLTEINNHSYTYTLMRKVNKSANSNQYLEKFELEKKATFEKKNSLI